MLLFSVLVVCGKPLLKVWFKLSCLCAVSRRRAPSLVGLVCAHRTTLRARLSTH